MSTASLETEITELRPHSFSGTLTFTCCGQVQQITGDKLTSFWCSVCHVSYGIILVPQLLSWHAQTWPAGTRVRLHSECSVQVGSVPLVLPAGTAYQVVHDYYNALSIPPEHVPLLINIPDERNCPRNLIAVIPVSFLEKIESETPTTS